MGFRAFHSCELEFTLFKETLESLDAKGFHDPVPLRPRRSFYHTYDYSCSCEFFNGLIDSMQTMGIAAEKIHFEYSPGAAEVVLRYREGIRAADDATIFKTFAKVFARQHDLLMSFMARWSDEVPGNSGHVHVSLRDEDDNTVFEDPGDPLGMSGTMRHFLGGLQRGIPELVLMLAPHFNSYKRFVPGIDTPLAAVWALDNRSVAFRVVGSTPSSLRIENRVGGSDVNPYLALACTLGAGLWGIEQELEPTDPIVGDAQEQMDQIPEHLHLPQSFAESIERFRNSEIARELFGEDFVRVFSDTRVQQDLLFRRSVSDHERRFFLELE
jgi:glutamine synthetase